MPPAELPIFTIGHSSRSIDAFLALLAESRLQCLVDVRRSPGSRAFPHFDAAALEASLAQAGIACWRLPALCGRRSAAEVRNLPVDGFWRNASFARYASWAQSEAFGRALDELLERAAGERCALMCAEAVWWRCHRRIIADHLLARGREVRHIMGPGKVVAATLTRGARTSHGTVVYPATRSATMSERFKVGDHVQWNSEAGYVSGRIIRVHTRDTTYKGHTRRCSEDDPQYEIKSDKTDHVAMHKGSALTLLDA